MPRTRSLCATALLSCVGLIGLAACGTNPAEAYQKTGAAAIAADAHAALTATTSLHVAGTVQVGSESLSVDLASDRSGALTGTATLGGATVQVLGTGGKGGQIYVKAGQDFWGKIAPQYAARLAGRWVLNVTPLPDVLKKFTLPELIANEATHRWEKETPHVIGTGNVNGEPTVEIAVIDGIGGATETLDVSATAPHHVVRESEGSTFTLTFDQFGATVGAVEPPASDVVDLLKVASAK